MFVISQEGVESFDEENRMEKFSTCDSDLHPAAGGCAANSGSPAAESGTGAASGNAPAVPASETSEETIKVGILHSLSGTMSISESIGQGRGAAGDRRDQRRGRRARQADRAGRRGRRVRLADIRREGEEADPAGQVADRVRLLDLGQPQGGAAGLRGAERAALVPGAVRGPGIIAEHLLHGRDDEPADRAGGRVPARRQGKRKFFLLGSDYVFPRTANEIIKAQLAASGGELGRPRSTRRSATPTTHGHHQDQRGRSRTSSSTR